MMTLVEWLKTLVVGRAHKQPDPLKAQLSRRNLDVADRLARMTGTTRDEVLKQAYRDADRSFAGRR